MYKLMHNWRRYPSSNWYEIDQKTRFEIWRSVVAPSDITDKNRNIHTQLHISPKLLPWNFLQISQL